MGNVRTQQRPARTGSARPRVRTQPTLSRSWGRNQPAAKQRGGAKKGLLMAVVPMVGGLVMKKLRSRQQAKKNIDDGGAGRRNSLTGNRRVGPGCSAAQAPPPSTPLQDASQNTPGIAVDLAEVTGDRAEHVPLRSLGSADGALVVLVGVDRLEHAVGGSGPGCDPVVVPVEPLQRVALLVGQGQRPALQRLARAGRPGGTWASRNLLPLVVGDR